MSVATPDDFFAHETQSVPGAGDFRAKAGQLLFQFASVRGEEVNEIRVCEDSTGELHAICEVAK